MASPTITATVDVARASVRLQVSFDADADTLTVWRRTVESGNLAYVRGWVEREVEGPGPLLVIDWEAPLGLELVYYARSSTGGVESEIGETGAPIVVDDARDWLVDIARPTNTMPVLIEALPELQFEAPAGVHRVLDRRDPILTTAPLWTPRGRLSVITGTLLERDRARAILGGGHAVLVRTRQVEGVGNLYVGVLGLVEQRASRIALYPDRRFLVDVVQVARPDPSLFVPAPPLTYAERSEMFATYADTTATGRSYQDVAYTFPPDRIDPSPPWLPDDV